MVELHTTAMAQRVHAHETKSKSHKEICSWCDSICFLYFFFSLSFEFGCSRLWQEWNAFGLQKKDENKMETKARECEKKDEMQSSTQIPNTLSVQIAKSTTEKKRTTSGNFAAHILYMVLHFIHGLAFDPFSRISLIVIRLILFCEFPWQGNISQASIVPFSKTKDSTKTLKVLKVWNCIKRSKLLLKCGKRIISQLQIYHIENVTFMMSKSIFVSRYRNNRIIHHRKWKRYNHKHNWWRLVIARENEIMQRLRTLNCGLCLRFCPSGHHSKLKYYFHFSQ